MFKFIASCLKTNFVHSEHGIICLSYSFCFSEKLFRDNIVSNAGR